MNPFKWKVCVQSGRVPAHTLNVCVQSGRVPAHTLIQCLRMNCLTVWMRIECLCAIRKSSIPHIDKMLTHELANCLDVMKNCVQSGIVHTLNVWTSIESLCNDCCSAFIEYRMNPDKGKAFVQLENVPAHTLNTCVQSGKVLCHTLRRCLYFSWQIVWTHSQTVCS